MRPLPPEHIGRFGPDDSHPKSYIPAPEVLAWVKEHILDEDGDLYNEDHAHLVEANIAFLWASSAFTKAGHTVVGQAEEVMFRCGPWQRGRQEQQMTEWFGYVPDFLITLAASYCEQCSDAEFCALVEHELYHLGHALDDFGQPKFTKEGLPKIAIRGHDVEEFTGVVRRYGASAEVQDLLDAAKGRPEVSQINVARACGTCLLKSA
ncbi:putative metallopeptidase [Chitinolyticbacter meiyuanensis]|uniref:putative metallopeptidase n=1 Tax=Chitinolyticbacter meiyuanensis TaxID=682798 RepID=UPI0011E5C610|nr:putative metallopeptidase [Chitinolyticbacter meiyuanensis]